mgnify:CR=1 FL=1
MEKLNNELQKLKDTIKEEQETFKEKYSENSLKLVEIYRQISEHDISIYNGISSMKELLSNLS